MSGTATQATSSAQRIRVALFLLATLSVLIATIVVLGHSSSLFARKATLHTSFENAGGLIAGSDVRLAGLAVGTVRAVYFDRDPKNRRVDVDLSVRAGFLDRIRADSVARVTSKGLLGDAMIDITVGNADQPALKDGDHIASAEPAGLAQLFEGLGNAARQIGTLFTPQSATDIGRILHATAGAAEGIEHGKGLIHALIFEPELANDTAQVVADVRRSVDEVDRVIADIHSGNGLLHDLIYDPRSGEIVARLHNVSANLDSVIAELRNGHGILHSLVYDEDQKNLVRDLTETARIIRQLAEETAQGKGTLGGLIKDPTVYEDLVTILGNVKRNFILKAIIRSTVSNDGLEAPGRVEPEPQPPKPPPPIPPASR